MSRHSSFVDSSGPNARRAATLASAGVRPSAMYCLVNCSRWMSSSRRMSASTRDDRKSDRSRSLMTLMTRTADLLRGFDQQADGGRQPLPGLQLALELFLALPRQRVELRVASEVGRFPFGADPALL